MQCDFLFILLLLFLDSRKRSNWSAPYRAACLSSSSGSAALSSHSPSSSKYPATASSYLSLRFSLTSNSRYRINNLYTRCLLTVSNSRIYDRRVSFLSLILTKSMNFARTDILRSTICRKTYFGIRFNAAFLRPYAVCQSRHWRVNSRCSMSDKG